MYQVGSSWEQATCIQGIKDGEDCPLCENGMRAAFVAAFSVIQLVDFETKKDKQRITALKSLFVVKGTSTKKLLKRRERCQNDLTGCMIECSRYEQKETGTGSEFEFIERMTPEQMMALRMTSGPYSVPPAEWLKPFDYLKTFEPMSADRLRKIIGVAAPIGSDSSVNSIINSQVSNRDDEAGVDTTNLADEI